jgi:DNA (cytosine-5)-methyltransferase 1
MGFETSDRRFRIPVSDTQAYKQFGNSVVVPVVEFVANAMKPHLEAALAPRIASETVSRRPAGPKMRVEERIAVARHG